MLKQVTLRHFKRFSDETFDLSAESIILVGPNNTGKTSLLQALAVWNLSLQKWKAERGPESGSKASKRTGVAITRKDFTAIPLREMDLLWTDRSTALRKDELKSELGQKLGTPRILKIELKGASTKGDWSLSLEFTYRYPDLIHVKPAEGIDMESVLGVMGDMQVVHVPPFSGIGAEETHYDKAYQDLLIGQGKPGDILRNLLWELYREKPKEWDKLCAHIKDIFGYQLLPPVYEGKPFIVCEYQPVSQNQASQRIPPRLDISSAGSGFLQVLMLFSFFYARPSSLLLFDEPDAHLHVILQKQVYDRLREVARQSNCQLLIATHSEVLVENTSPERILSFFRHPHKLVDDTTRDQVCEALKRLNNLDILLAEQTPAVLYVESATDLALLREWAHVLNHSLYQFLAENPFWHNNQGRHPRESRAHFFALKAVQPEIKGILILDGDNRKLPEHEILAEGLTILRWTRYEIENYLVHPEVLTRFVKGVSPDLFTTTSAERGLKYLQDELPPAVYKNPLVDHDYLNNTPASKTLLPGFFKTAGISLTKDEYYQVAAKMNPQDIPTEVKDKLDAIYSIYQPLVK